MLAINKKDYIIDISNEFARFQLINIKPYYNKEDKYNNIENEFLDNKFEI